ncbi:hypothetical protein KFL_010860030, partial [Klebsormidium nitens]
AGIKSQTRKETKTRQEKNLGKARSVFVL